MQPLIEDTWEGASLNKYKGVVNFIYLKVCNYLHALIY